MVSGTRFRKWTKRGRTDIPSPLEYQRYLSLTENVAQGSGTIPNLIDLTVHPLTPNEEEDWIQTYYMVPAMKSRWRKTDIAVNFKLLKKIRDEEAKKVESHRPATIR